MKRRAEHEENSSSKKPKYDMISLDDVQLIDVGNAAAVARYVKATPDLQSLDLSYMQITGSAAELFFAGLQGNKYVTSIDISQNDLGSKGSEAIARWLYDNNTLTVLDLSYSNVASKGVASIVNALNGNSALKILALRDNDIGDDPIVALMRLLGENVLCLEELYIERVCLLNSFNSISNMLRTNTSLKILNLSGNPISSYEVASFGSALQFNTTLQSLNIYGIDEKRAYDGQELESEDLNSFSHAIKNNKSLIELNIPHIDSCSNGAVRRYYAAVACHKTMLYCTKLAKSDRMQDDAERLRLMLQKKNREILLDPFIHRYSPARMVYLKDVVLFLASHKAIDGALTYSYARPGDKVLLSAKPYSDYMISPSTFYMSIDVKFYKDKCRSALIAILAVTNDQTPLISVLPKGVLSRILELSGYLGEKHVAQAIGIRC